MDLFSKSGILNPWKVEIKQRNFTKEGSTQVSTRDGGRLRMPIHPMQESEIQFVLATLVAKYVFINARNFKKLFHFYAQYKIF